MFVCQGRRINDFFPRLPNIFAQKSSQEENRTTLSVSLPRSIAGQSLGALSVAEDVPEVVVHVHGVAIGVLSSLSHVGEQDPKRQPPPKCPPR